MRILPSSGLRFYLLGHPVSHSLSPAIFGAAFAASGLRATYEALDVPPAELAGTCRDLVADTATGGFNVTLPHKTAVIPLLDGLAPEAEEIGAVNTVVAEGGRTRGHNTDLGGFLDSLPAAGVPVLTGRSVLLLGAGGAAKAVVFALADLGAGKVVLANRTPEAAEALAREANERRPGLRILPVPLLPGELPRGAEEAVLCVQATSLGLSEEDPLPLPPRLLPAGCFVYDLVYGPAGTPLVRAARGAGFPAADGKEMLLAQAARSFSLWMGREAPREVMRRALADGLSRTSP